MSVVVVMPSRGRPERAYSAIDAIRQTAVLISTSVILAVDANDPCWYDYAAIAGQRRLQAGPEVTLVTLRGDETGDLVRATNTVSMRVARSDPDSIIGNLGDDHFCRTPGWDRLITEALTQPGIAYGDDLLQGQNLPTAPFVSASIVNALGWYFLPTLRHMFVDDALKTIGEAAGILRYLPDVVIEHLHPGAGKAQIDAGYVRADASTEADRQAFDLWRETWLADDLSAVRTALNVEQGKRDRYPVRA